jgi:predicted 2-oxoglutarate/Fe(II)-dependent dioxygenase YbiX
MKVKYFNEPIPFYIITNYLNGDEKTFYLKELCKMKSTLQRNGTGGAIDLEGNLQKQNYGAWVDENHNLHKLANKLFGPIAWETRNHWFYKIINKLTKYSTLVSYYEDCDYYLPHIDDSILTSILYLWNEPKTFTGGELCFGEYIVPIENNSLVIFPSMTEHSVKPLNGYGRWAITHFLHEYFKPNIQEYHNILNISLFKKIQNTIKNEKWEFVGSYWKIDLNNNQLFTRDIFNIICNAIGKTIQLKNVYACGQLYGQNITTRVIDSTFILHTNEIEDDDILLWDGETANKKPIANSGIFLEKLEYTSQGPSRLVSDLKVTIIWIFQY